MWDVRRRSGKKKQMSWEKIRWVSLKQNKKKRAHFSWKRIELLFWRQFSWSHSWPLKDSWGRHMERLKTTSFKVVTGVFYSAFCTIAAMAVHWQNCAPVMKYSWAWGSLFLYNTVFRKWLRSGRNGPCRSMYYVSEEAYRSSRSLESSP